MKKHNFSAGPAILAPEVLKQASEAALDYNGIGLSILEISHRSKEFKDVLAEIQPLTLELLGLSSDEYAPLFLTGGASSQFFMSAMNLLNEGEKVAYVDTGAWSKKAIKEANLFGKAETIASSADKNYNYIPKDVKIPSEAKYVHITTNNTIFGTQYHDLPATDKYFVADMSSDIFSKERDFSKFGLIYAGAQKNLGPAGVTLVVVKKDLLGHVSRVIPTMLNYETHIAKESAFNTPPVFPIYTCLLSMRWLKSKGGVKGIQKHNEAKADLMYGEIDRNPLFVGTAEKEDRSIMNTTFLLNDESLQDEFLAACTAAGISGVKGHRSVGGFRASIYNAMPLESVQVLVDVMQDFEKKNG